MNSCDKHKVEVHFGGHPLTECPACEKVKLQHEKFNDQIRSLGSAIDSVICDLESIKETTEEFRYEN